MWKFAKSRHDIGTRKKFNSQEVTSNTKSARDDQSQGVKRRITLSESVDVLRGVLDILRSGKVVGVDSLLRVRLGSTGSQMCGLSDVSQVDWPGYQHQSARSEAELRRD